MQAVEAARTGNPDAMPEGVQDALYEHSWRLRQQMDGTPATSLADVVVKIAAADVALASDTEMENRGAGSFPSPAQSIFRDVRALTGATTDEGASP